MEKRHIVAVLGLAAVLAAGGGMWFMGRQEAEPIVIEVTPSDVIHESTTFVPDESAWESEPAEFFDEDEVDSDVTRIIIGDDVVNAEALLGEVLGGKVIINNEVVQDGDQTVEVNALGTMHGE